MCKMNVTRILSKYFFSKKIHIVCAERLRHIKMAQSSNAGRDSPRLNGWEKVPKPFLIGVAGGTASGKV